MPGSFLRARFSLVSCSVGSSDEDHCRAVWVAGVPAAGAGPDQLPEERHVGALQPFLNAVRQRRRGQWEQRVTLRVGALCP